MLGEQEPRTDLEVGARQVTEASRRSRLGADQVVRTVPVDSGSVPGRNLGGLCGFAMPKFHRASENSLRAVPQSGVSTYFGKALKSARSIRSIRPSYLISSRSGYRFSKAS